MKSLLSFNFSFFLLLLIPFNWTIAQSQPQNPTLYPIEENGLYGFINPKGEKVIPPSFHAVGLFSEGLAAARKEGLYGFIDETGSYVILPKYDYAQKFEDGMAMVWLGSKPYFIDREGRILFEHDFSELFYFEGKELAKVKTKDGKYGMINQKWELIVDTAYYHIEEFSEGRAVVTSFNTDYDLRKKGVIDKRGKFVVPLGRFSNIRNYSDGWAGVRMNLTKEERQKYKGNSPIKFIDLQGNIVLELSPKDFLYVQSFKNGKAEAELSKNEDYSSRGTVVINKKGEIIEDLSDMDWHNTPTSIPFVKNKFFEYLKNHKDSKDWQRSWRLTDEKGNPLSDDKFDHISDIDSINQIASISKDGKWGIIDANGDYIFPPIFEEVNIESLRNGLFFYSKKVDLDFKGKKLQKNRWGIATIEGEILVEPTFHSLIWADTVKQIAYGENWEKRAYVNAEGSYLWENYYEMEEGSADKPLILNLDYMNINNHYVGHGFSEEIEGELESSSNQLSIKVNQESSAKAIFSIVQNSTKDTVLFEGIDGLFNLIIQAKDETGRWGDIEMLPVVFCGNSYHTISLAPNEYFKFKLPHYHGVFNTYLRVKLTYFVEKEPKEMDDATKKFLEEQPFMRDFFEGDLKEYLVIYSNVFKGSVNPGQFWRKYEYGGGYNLRNLLRD